MSGASARLAATAAHLSAPAETAWTPPQPAVRLTSPPGAFPVAADAAALAAQCARDGVRIVRMCFLASSASLLTYLVPADVFFARHAVKGRNLVPALNSFGLGEDEPAPGIIDAGLVDLEQELDFFPDWTTFRYLPHAPGQAIVMGNTILRTPGPETVLWNYDPRNVLRLLTEKLRDKWGLEMICGTESEFYLYDDTDPATNGPIPFDRTLYGAAWALYGRAGRIFEELILAVKAAGIGVYDAHSEIGPGQFEIATDPSEANRCAYELLLTREVIRGTARNLGVNATFAPKPLREEIGTGCHVHLSLRSLSTGRNVFPSSSSPHGLSEIGASFVAGILSHARALCAVSLPSVPSYVRAKPGMLAGGWTCWGLENRDACLRLATNREGARDVEWRFSDCTGNPFAVLAGLLAAGIDGLEKGMKLPPPVKSLDFRVGAEELAKQGVYPVPGSLEEATDIFEKDAVLAEALGPLAKGIVFLRRHEAKRWGAMTPADMDREIMKLF
ncbi:hypothetical protein DFJ74DRAFT_696391 [Hyaloraphidium curvatum]|nr:hypothetical protein DFJ74DRAFT_696391 [Hyaloraphidium curvatum]